LQQVRDQKVTIFERLKAVPAKDRPAVLEEETIRQSRAMAQQQKDQQRQVRRYFGGVIYPIA
jgi:hypothetical protein